MSYPYLIQGDSIVVVLDGATPHTITTSHANFGKIKEAIKKKDWDEVKSLIDVSSTIVNYSNGAVTVEHGVLHYNNKPLHNMLATRIIEMIKEGFEVDPLIAFLDRLMKNPSNRAVDQLYEFLERGKLPITSDGFFLAYKRVRDDYLDCHSGSISNHIGAVVEMPRNLVDDDPENTCSHGLHFCSLEYLSHFGGARTVVVKIDPADVVCIPYDYNYSKCRCCRYEVIGEISANTEEKAFVKSVQDNAEGVINPLVKPAVRIPRSGSAIRTDLPQEYDAKGRPLSMTADAVRKREARRAGRIK